MSNFMADHGSLVVTLVGVYLVGHGMYLCPRGRC